MIDLYDQVSEVGIFFLWKMRFYQATIMTKLEGKKKQTKIKLKRLVI